MHESDEFDWRLLDRYAANEATAEESSQVEHWLAGDAGRVALLDAMRARAATSDWNTPRAWPKVRTRAGLTPAQRRAAHRWQITPALLRAAAAIVVVAGGTVLVRALLERSAPDNAALVAVVTARSESDTIRLADGSEIVLSADSRLEYPSTFAATSREVRLAGEALFRVVSDTSRPFTVHAGEVQVRVVGTEFVTRTPADAGGEVVVAVVAGAVAVRARTGEVTVRPGQVAHVSADGTHQVQETDLEPYLDWTQGRLVFDDAPVSDVFAELERWYRVEFRAQGELNSRRVTARLRAGSLDETVAALALALGAGQQRTNDIITFTTK